jgi:hypothetical protein
VLDTNCMLCFSEMKQGPPFSLKNVGHNFTNSNTLLTTIFRILNHKSTGEAGRKAWMKCILESMTNSCMPGRPNLFKVLTYLLQVLILQHAACICLRKHTYAIYQSCSLACLNKPKPKTPRVLHLIFYTILIYSTNLC